MTYVPYDMVPYETVCTCWHKSYVTSHSCVTKHMSDYWTDGNGPLSPRYVWTVGISTLQERVKGNHGIVISSLASN
jgi:hypothetical protein